jgi:cytochrome oxidase Cu insertion factor (SCO1/SenC/PrrC family)
MKGSLSISVDPIQDTSPRLQAYAAKLRGKPGWFLLTGKKENV